MLRKRRPTIIDIEALGFVVHGNPIDVGVVLYDGTKYCSLILAQADWAQWEVSTEKVNGYRATFSKLETYSKPMTEVVSRLNELLRALNAYNDGWEAGKT